MNDKETAADVAMSIVKDYPPNIQAIRDRFGPVVMQRGVIFTYGERIFNPSGRPLSVPLINHERVHASQQLRMGVDAWWDRYLIDHVFRYGQEREAHIAEWLTVLASNSNRATRREQLSYIAKRLSGPLYGHLATYADAKKMLRHEGIKTRDGLDV